MTILRSTLAAASVCLILGAVPAAASDQYWEFRDWRVHVETVDTGEDLRITCRASTGGDGLPVLSADLSNGDAGPPDFYPSVTLTERAPRHYTTLMQDGDPITFLFDDGNSGATTAMAGFDDEGFAQAFATFDGSRSRLILEGMRHAGELEILAPGGTVFTASLDGFTASYLKMAEQCGFSTAGVID